MGVFCSHTLTCLGGSNISKGIFSSCCVQGSVLLNEASAPSTQRNKSSNQQGFRQRTMPCLIKGLALRVLGTSARQSSHQWEKGSSSGSKDEWPRPQDTDALQMLYPEVITVSWRVIVTEQMKSRSGHFEYIIENICKALHQRCEISAVSHRDYLMTLLLTSGLV